MCLFPQQKKIKALIHRADVAKRPKEKLHRDHCDRLTVESIHFFNESYKYKCLHHFKQDCQINIQKFRYIRISNLDISKTKISNEKI